MLTQILPKYWASMLTSGTHSQSHLKMVTPWLWSISLEIRDQLLSQLRDLFSSNHQLVPQLRFGLDTTLALIQWMTQYHSDCIKMDMMFTFHTAEVCHRVMWKKDVHMKMHVSGTGLSQIWQLTTWKLRCNTSMAKRDRKLVCGARLSVPN